MFAHINKLMDMFMAGLQGERNTILNLFYIVLFSGVIKRLKMLLYYNKARGTNM